jgi:chorismate mutase
MGRKTQLSMEVRVSEREEEMTQRYSRNLKSAKCNRSHIREVL